METSICNQCGGSGEVFEKTLVVDLDPRYDLTTCLACMGRGHKSETDRSIARINASFAMNAAIAAITDHFKTKLKGSKKNANRISK